MLKRTLLFCCLILVACQPSTDDKKQLDALWQNILDVNASYDTYHAVMDSKQSMSSNGKVVSANAAIDLYISEAPFTSSQTINIQLDHTQSAPTKYYTNDNYVYVHLPTDFKWSMLQAKAYDETKQSVKQYEALLKEQAGLIHHYNAEYEMKESKHLYSFKIDQSSKFFTDLYVRLANKALPDDFGSILDTINIEQGNIEIDIDKSDFKLRKIKSYAVYQTKVKGIDAKIEQTILEIYTKHNQTKVPVDQDGINNAEIL